MLSPTRGQIPTRYSPVRHSHPAETRIPFDLHVLSMPPAFNLSQDQTLQFKPSFDQHRAKTRHQPNYQFDEDHPETLGLQVLLRLIQSQPMPQSLQRKHPHKLLSQAVKELHRPVRSARRAFYTPSSIPQAVFSPLCRKTATINHYRQSIIPASQRGRAFY